MYNLFNAQHIYVRLATIVAGFYVFSKVITVFTNYMHSVGGIFGLMGM